MRFRLARLADLDTCRSLIHPGLRLTNGVRRALVDIWRHLTADDVACMRRIDLNTADHPEFPSGSACFCAAHAQASRRYLGSDAFGFAMPVAKGSSVIEPGITPVEDIMLGPWNTFTEFEKDCGMSRFWGGVHFLSSLSAGRCAARSATPLTSSSNDTSTEARRKLLSSGVLTGLSGLGSALRSNLWQATPGCPGG